MIFGAFCCCKKAGGVVGPSVVSRHGQAFPAADAAPKWWWYIVVAAHAWK